MKNLLIVLFFTAAVSVKAQQAFTISGYGKKIKDGDRIYLNYRDGDKMVYDSTLAKNGAYSFKGIAQNITKADVNRNNNPKYAAVLYDLSVIFLESGNIKLVSPDTLLNSIISGTTLNIDQAELTRMLKPNTDKRRGLPDMDQLNPQQLKDTAWVQATKERWRQNFLASFAPRFKFIRKHTNSYVSLVNLADMARISSFLPEVERCYALLNNRLKRLPEAANIEQRIARGKIVTINSVAKDFTMANTRGKPVSLSDFKGQYVLLDFWASWCGPCRAETPNIVQNYQRYKNKKFTVVSVSEDVEKARANWLKAVMDDKMTWTNLSDLKAENQAFKLYGITTIPANVLIDPSGKIIAKDLRGADLSNKLRGLLSDR